MRSRSSRSPCLVQLGSPRTPHLPRPPHAIRATAAVPRLGVQRHRRNAVSSETAGMSRACSQCEDSWSGSECWYKLIPGPEKEAPAEARAVLEANCSASYIRLTVDYSRLPTDWFWNTSGPLLHPHPTAQITSRIIVVVVPAAGNLEICCCVGGPWAN
jgi:hypothetical protein